MAAGHAVVKQVLSGDTVVLVGAPKGGPPPEKTVTLASLMAPRMAMRSLQHEMEDEPFAYAAREFLRQWLIGHAVQFAVEFSEREREFASLVYEGEDVGLAVVRAGWARVRNPRQGSPAAKNIEALRAAENDARTAKRGLWSEDPADLEKSVRPIQWLQGDSAGGKAFAAVHKNQKLAAIVEFVRDAGCYRCYFPEKNVYGQVMLAGIVADGFRRVEGYDQPTPEPFAIEGKYFAEIRLLNREVKVRIVDADDYGNLIGELLHPNGNIAMLLLRNGFAKVQEYAVRACENPSAYREAQKEAQTARIRKWRSWVPPAAADCPVFQARVIEVLSGDCIIASCDAGGEADVDEKRLYIASIRCPRTGTRTRAAEPFAFEAKEFARKKLVGKTFQVTVEYTRQPVVTSPTQAAPPPPSDASGRMLYVSIALGPNGPDYAASLIEAGLAKTQQHRGEDPRAANYEELVEKEQQAMEAKFGVHGSVSAARSIRVNELIGPENAGRARSFEDVLKRAGDLEGLVEHVFNGSRFRVRVEHRSDVFAISFILAGIRCPRGARPGQKTGEEFAEEATQFSRERYQQRPVRITVEACDKGGNFIGQMWRGNEHVNLALVEAGWARVSDAGFGQKSSALQLAQQTAQERRLGLWSSATAFETADMSATTTAESGDGERGGMNLLIPDVSIVSCSDVLDFSVRDENGPFSEIQLRSKIDEFIASLSEIARLAEQYSAAALPNPKTLILAKFSEDNFWYRAVIDKNDKQQAKLRVTYVDYGNSEEVSIKDVLKCPPSLSLTAIPALCRRCMLLGVLPPHDLEVEASDYFAVLLGDRRFKCLVDSVDPVTRRSKVLLYAADDATVPLATSGTPLSINATVLREGWGLLDKKLKLSDYYSKLHEAQEHARTQRLNVWRHGHVDESDEESFVTREFFSSTMLDGHHLSCVLGASSYSLLQTAKVIKLIQALK